MKIIKPLRTIPGIALVIIAAASSGVGVYALSNWFGGDVQVSQDASVFSIDLSACKGNLPPGVNEYDNRHKIQFKIMGSPHVSAQELRQDLLGECEYNVVTDFYDTKFPDAVFSRTGGTRYFKYTTQPAVITGIDNNMLTVKYVVSKAGTFGTRSLRLAPDVLVYSEGQASSASSLQLGDNVVFIAYSASTSGPMVEGATILDASDVQIQGIFKTQYNDGVGSNFTYETDNVMPLDMLSK
ncbi:MAG TPA: hypothetical protein VLG92_05375 [Candidatus Saccharimonadia bacterium]|nr:hypothetical protein [Candidatus Saccharimonadia bacterium]